MSERERERQRVHAAIEGLARHHLELLPPLLPGARLVEDLGLDSMRRLQLAIEVENHFRICLEPQDEAQIATVGDLVRVVAAKRRRAAQGSPGDSGG